MTTLTAPSAFPNVPQQVAELEFDDEEQQRKIWDSYEQEILKTLEKDRWVPYTSDFWDKIRAEVEQRLQAKQSEKTV